MGSRIAAHFANAGIPALLLDLTTKDAQRGIDTAIKQNPGAFFTPAAASLVTSGSFNDNLPAIKDCDWIIEAVTENLGIKRDLWTRVEQQRKPGAILSTNTSGIPLAHICDGFPQDFRLNFLGTHFFNPPRYLHLVEVIPGPETNPGLLTEVSAYCDLRLGKGVVLCKDTPNFIGNRIGSFYGATTHKITLEDDYTIEEVDALTGPLIGLPKSASYRLLDIVGLDIWAHVSNNLYSLVPHDPWRERLLPPPFLSQMLERKWLGEKTGQGFYKRVGPAKEIHAIDWKTFDYHVAAKPKIPSVDLARNIEDLPYRLRTLVAANDRAGNFLWKLFSDVFLYSASMIPEISDRIVEIDRAMRWGYAHTYGPFELWDALGLEDTCNRMEQEGRALPENIVRMRRAGAEAFYKYEGPRTRYFDLIYAGYNELEPRPGIESLAIHKRSRSDIKSNAGASLVDVGDGVLCLEFHSKMNTLGEDAISMLFAALEETERNYEALVIANEGENFSAGANLVMVLLAAQERDWEELDASIRRFQRASMALKYAAKPVVAAPFSRVLGGGCEWVLHSTRAQASAETYMGLVEVGVGLIPAGGGCKEMIAAPQGSSARLRTHRHGQGLDVCRRCPQPGPPPQDRPHQHESRAPAARRKVAGPIARADPLPRRPADKHQSLWRRRVRRHETRCLEHAAGRIHFGTRRHHRRKARLHPQRRPRTRRACRLRTASPRPGARSIPLPLRHAENTGAHPVHVEKRQAPPELE